MSLGSEAKISLLKERALMLARARTFFNERSILEVDPPILSRYAPIDVHIDVMKVDMGGQKIGYLHTSPEYALKKLLALGVGDLYQLSHVFRAGESSPLHLPEFTMAEWYRISLGYFDFIEETLAFIRLFLGDLPSEILTYREALSKYANIDYVTESKTLFTHTTLLAPDSQTWELDDQLSLLFSHLVEPHLGKERLTVITGYPASQAALAKTESVEGVELARRFEIYYRGIELANGYDELTQAGEQASRLEKENAKRVELGKESLPLDVDFIKALEEGLPDCRGVAVGFDRLLMLRSSRSTLAQWELFSPL